MSLVQLRRGVEADRQPVHDLLASYQMDAELAPAEFLVATLDEHLVGAARLEWEADKPYIRPLVVESKWHGNGIGRLLIQSLLKHSPTLNVVARGQAAAFYQRLGFRPIAWEQVPARYQSECESCPEQDACNPTPMTLNSYNPENLSEIRIISGG